MQKSLSKSSLGIKNNQMFLKLMSRKYARQVESCENANPLPIRTAGGYDAAKKRSSLNFSLPTMPLSQKGHSLERLPRKGQNLLPAIAMMPEEHSKYIVKNLGLN